MQFLFEPWPWYVAGPLIGLIVPLLLLLGGKPFGLSANLRHMCAAVLPANLRFFRYDWRKEGGWNLVFALGILIGGFIGSQWLLPDRYTVAIADSTRHDLLALGLQDLSGFMPRDLFSWSALTTGRGLAVIMGGGFLVGFGARWAGGCTSGHAISGLATMQLPSLIAVAGFFTGGLLMTHLLLPLIF